MVMSQGTATFLACFAGFWLVWALVVALCCLCSLLQRRLKRRREPHRRGQGLGAAGMVPLARPPPPPPPPPPFSPAAALSPPPGCDATPLPELHRVTMPDVNGNPPCYEEAMLMEDPPPPYNEVLADTRGGTFLKAERLPPTRRAQTRDPVTALLSNSSKPRGDSSPIRLTSLRRWDSLGQLLTNMDLSRSALPPPQPRCPPAAGATAAVPCRAAAGTEPALLGFGRHAGLRRGQAFDEPEPSCGLPTAYPLLGRSTAV